MSARTGRCLCGAATVRATFEPHFGACHCSMCRRWGGGPLMAVDCSDAAFDGGDIQRFRSSEWAERGFCAKCGTHLFYYLVPAQRYVVPVGLFDDMSGLTFHDEIYIDGKPECYEFAGERKRLTEAEFLASIGMGGES